MQVYLVALIGLVMRIDAPTLKAEEGFDQDFYGTLMYSLLIITLLPAVAVLLYKTPAERALIALQKKAAEGSDNFAIGTTLRTVATSVSTTAKNQQVRIKQLHEGVKTRVCNTVGVTPRNEMQRGHTIVDVGISSVGDDSDVDDLVVVE